MKRLILLIFVLLYAGRSFGQKEFNQKLGDLATVTFIHKPEIKKTGPTVTVYRADEIGKAYLVQDIFAKKSFSESFDTDINDVIYSSYIRGILKSMQGEVFYKKDTILNGTPGIAFAYKGVIDSVPCYSYHYATYLGNHLLSTMVWSSDSLAWKDPHISKFFNSLQLTAKGKSFRDREVDDANVSVGHIMAVSGAIIGGLILILVVIFQIRKKKQNG